MTKYIKNLRLQILAILLIPALGLFYFSSSYVYSNYKEYMRSLYLTKAVNLVAVTIELIKSLQKERGISIASLAKEKNHTSLLQQRKRSDQQIAKYFRFIAGGRVPIPNLKAIIEDLERLKLVRANIDAGKLTYLQILQNYSAIIKKLIDSTKILDKNYINENFFKMVLTFHNILQLSEINGQERALIAYLLQKKRKRSGELFAKILSLEIQNRAFEELLHRNLTPALMIIYRRFIPLAFEEKFKGLKEEILQRKHFAIITKDAWWNIATKYVEALFRTDRAILKKIFQEQAILKTKTLRALIVSFVIWILAFLSLGLFLMLFERLMKRFRQYAYMLHRDKRLYSVYSEFSENVLHVDNLPTLLNLFAVFVDKTGLFAFTFLYDTKKGQVIIYEKIPLSTIKEKILPRLRESMESVQKSGKYRLLQPDFTIDIDSSIKQIAIFPIYLEKECAYQLIVGAKSILRMAVVDLILKMKEILESSLKQIVAKEHEKRLYRKLQLLSHTFEAHEAIVITDKNGDILNVNQAFEKITGYSKEEVLGKNPSILKSGKHSSEFYEKMWRDIKEKGYWKGEIYNKRKDGTIYPEILSITAIKDEKGQVINYISHFFDISDLKKIQEENEKRATHDLLTEVYNRAKLLEELERVQKSAKKAGYYNAFLFIDLDNFKFINDSYGHAMGDRVLIEVAKKIKSIKKDRDFVARISGDEFALVLVDIGTTAQEASTKAATVAQKLLDAYQKPVIIEDREIEIAFSIGIYIFPTDEKGVEEIITNADIAMYHSKKNGKRSFSFYDDKLDIESKQYLIMKKEIEKGLQKGEFEVYYQPKVSLGSGDIVGFEALVRWNSQVYGFLFPNKFFSYINGNRLQHDMTMYVIEKVLDDLPDFLQHKSLKIAINISTEQFNNQRFMQEIKQKLQQRHEESIILEILEDTFMRDMPQAVAHIEEFKEMGIDVAIDDFGTGYSSLSYLRDLPVNELKIDKSFIIHLFENRNDVIVQKIVEIAKIFGYCVTAEGVENAKAVDFLKKIGCDNFQGFYFSRAVAKEKALEMLR